MNRNKADYLFRQLRIHLNSFFKQDVVQLAGNIHFCKTAEAAIPPEKGIYIPYDIEVKLQPDDIYNISCNDTTITLWNRIAKPDGDWKTLLDGDKPVWYQHSNGSLMPAWNLFGNLFALLSYAEERQTAECDEHGRFNTKFSPRFKQNLLEIPAFNESAVLLAGALLWQDTKTANFQNCLEFVKPPVMVLSHDCDVLYGNDFWTQIVRLYRVFLPLKKLRLPNLTNIWWIIRNYITPKRFYFDNVKGMVEIEKVYGHKSTFYMLNGTYGRFGSRSGIDAIKEVVDDIPSNFEIGMHYNYDTYLNESLFKDQYDELQSCLNKPVVAGRAHYLKFDPSKSFDFLENQNIQVDESVGFTHSIGFRAGLAGYYFPFNEKTEKEYQVLEIPVNFMDARLVEQYAERAIERFTEIAKHIGKIGGAISIVFHPGQFFNPEHKKMLGIYHKMLLVARQLSAESKSATEILSDINQYSESESSLN